MRAREAIHPATAAVTLVSASAASRFRDIPDIVDEPTANLWVYLGWYESVISLPQGPKKSNVRLKVRGSRSGRTLRFGAKPKCSAVPRPHRPRFGRRQPNGRYCQVLLRTPAEGAPMNCAHSRQRYGPYRQTVPIPGTACAVIQFQTTAHGPTEGLATRWQNPLRIY